LIVFSKAMRGDRPYEGKKYLFGTQRQSKWVRTGLRFERAQIEIAKVAHERAERESRGAQESLTRMINRRQ